jgi:hypothetical protein
MIETTTEQMRLLTKAAADVPGRPHISTLMRWALRGVKGVRLETVVIGGRRFTSLEAIQRFIARLSQTRSSDPSTPHQHECEVEKEVDAMGFKSR